MMNLTQLSEIELDTLAADIADERARRQAERLATASPPPRLALDRDTLAAALKAGEVRDADIHGQDLTGFNLGGAHFVDCTFYDTDFTLAKLDNTTFERCHFRRNHYRAISLKNVQFIGCTINGFILERAADLRGIQFTDCRTFGPLRINAVFDDDGPVRRLADSHLQPVNRLTHRQFVTECKSERAEREAARAEREAAAQAAHDAAEFRRRCDELRQIRTLDLLNRFRETPDDAALCHVLDMRLA